MFNYIKLTIAGLIARVHPTTTSEALSPFTVALKNLDKVQKHTATKASKHYAAQNANSATIRRLRNKNTHHEVQADAAWGEHAKAINAAAKLKQFAA